MEDESIIWQILDEAADDEYILITEHLLGGAGGKSAGILSRLKHSSKSSYEKFINQIQFKILDHPKSLQCRSLAWSNIDHEHVDTQRFVEKAQEICIRFDKDAKNLWESAFRKVVSLFKERKM